ncbi:MAG: peptidase S10, partial [Terracoccus sp.]
MADDTAAVAAEPTEPTEPGARAATTKPDPVDDTVTTHHVLEVGAARLAYTATTGRIVLREEEHTDGTFG